MTARRQVLGWWSNGIQTFFLVKGEDGRSEVFYVPTELKALMGMTGVPFVNMEHAVLSVLPKQLYGKIETYIGLGAANYFIIETYELSGVPEKVVGPDDITERLDITPNI